jgi:hypothetical protein
MRLSRRLTRLGRPKVRSGMDALITTLRDPIDAEVFGAGAADSVRLGGQAQRPDPARDLLQTRTR